MHASDAEATYIPLEGDSVQLVKNGFARMRCSDGATYEGEVANYLKNGNGTLRYVNGNVYTGEWRNDDMHGYGTMRRFNGDVYEGEWRLNKENGKGVARSGNTVYEGEFFDGLYSGYGTRYRRESSDSAEDVMDSYTGEWLKGMYNGTGTIRYADGDMYEGSFRDHQAHGNGRFVAVDGSVYTGPFVKGKAEGEGVETFPCGDYYVGTFVGGRRNGMGTYTNAAKGLKMSGYSSNGRFEGRIEIGYPSGLRISAVARNGLQFGDATLYFPDGLRVHGNLVMEDDRMIGMVRVEDIDGSVVNADLNQLSNQEGFTITAEFFRSVVSYMKETAGLRASLFLINEAIEEARDEKKKETTADARRRKKERQRQRRVQTEREEEKRRDIEKQLREKAEADDRVSQATVKLCTALSYAQNTYEAEGTRKAARDSLQRIRRALEVNREASPDAIERARTLRAELQTRTGRSTVSNKTPMTTSDLRPKMTRASGPEMEKSAEAVRDTVRAKPSVHDSKLDECRELCCPITLQVFQDPVMTINGNTYERAAIEEWFSLRSHPEDPLTGIRLESDVLIPNHALRCLVAMRAN